MSDVENIYAYILEGDPEAPYALDRAIAHAETVVRLVGGAV